MSVADSFKQKFRTIILMARDSLRLILIASLVTSPSSIANSLTDPFAVDQTAKSTQPSLGITANDLARRFKHPEPGAFELTKFLRNPDTGDLECSVTGIDRTTAITANTRNSDSQLCSVTLLWNIPNQDATAVNKNGVTEQQRNSIKQFYMTALLLIEAIDQSSSVDDRKQLLTDLHLIGSNTAQTDSQLSKNGFVYRTHWTDHKLALTIEAEQQMQPGASRNSRGAQPSHPEITRTPDDVALLKALADSDNYDARKGVSPLNFPDMDSYRAEGWRRLIVIAKIYEDRYHDPGRALDYYNLVKNNMTGAHTASRELNDKIDELRMRMIQQGYKPHHYEVVDPRYSR